MWLRVPDTVDDPLWQGELEPDDAPAAWRDEPGPDDGTDGSRRIRELPVVSIGRPEVWNVADLCDPEKLPPTMRSRMARARFHLVRLSCSFRPVHDRTSIEWARLAVTLRPDGAGRTATAIDLHPLLVTQEAKRNLKVTLAPSLKFLEVEAGVGEVAFGFEYPDIQPVISASGAGESEPAWDFTAAAGAHIHGSKWMHLMLMADHAMVACDATLHLTADVVRAGLRIPVFSRPKQRTADPLTVRLYG